MPSASFLVAEWNSHNYLFINQLPAGNGGSEIPLFSQQAEAYLAKCQMHTAAHLEGSSQQINRRTIGDDRSVIEILESDEEAGPLSGRARDMCVELEEVRQHRCDSCPPLPDVCLRPDALRLPNSRL